MRIEAYNQVAQIYGAAKTAKTAKANAASTVSFGDQLQISRTGQEFQIAKQAVAAASDTRNDKTAELKSRIDSGNYHVSTEDFAAKLLEKYNAAL